MPSPAQLGNGVSKHAAGTLGGRGGDGGAGGDGGGGDGGGGDSGELAGVIRTRVESYDVDGGALFGHTARVPVPIKYAEAGGSRTNLLPPLLSFFWPSPPPDA